jgi:hypothetical protein
VRAVSGAPVFLHSQFVSNVATLGGGLYLMWAEALVEDNLFRGNAAASHGGGIYLSGASSTIKGNLIAANEGVSGGGIGIQSGPSPVIVTGNRTLENQALVGGGVAVQGFYVELTGAELDNNILGHNTADTGAGIYVRKCSPVLRHNTLARLAGISGAGVFVGEEAAVSLTNTILASHMVGITVTAGSTATMEGTLWGGGTWANGIDWAGDGHLSTGTVNLWGDPAFADPVDGDYHIGSLSAARDVGVDAGLTTDIDGDTRPQGSGYDIGADEFTLPPLYLPVVVCNN